MPGDVRYAAKKALAENLANEAAAAKARALAADQERLRLEAEHEKAKASWGRFKGNVDMAAQISKEAAAAEKRQRARELAERLAREEVEKGLEAARAVEEARLLREEAERERKAKRDQGIDPRPPPPKQLHDLRPHPPATYQDPCGALPKPSQGNQGNDDFLPDEFVTVSPSKPRPSPHVPSTGHPSGGGRPTNLQVRQKMKAKDMDENSPLACFFCCFPKRSRPRGDSFTPRVTQGGGSPRSGGVIHV